LPARAVRHVDTILDVSPSELVRLRRPVTRVSRVDASIKTPPELRDRRERRAIDAWARRIAAALTG
jgi:hypothetical protein